MEQRRGKRSLLVLLIFLIPATCGFLCCGFLGLYSLLPDMLPSDDESKLTADYSPWLGGTFLPVDWFLVGTDSAGGDVRPGITTEIALLQTV
ncbi:MAG TPA: hypothetical protein VJZ27_12330, partial [Aggregatilineales bacterium]|nr:hypothetical protein [Aggregatilineales bacterium]